MTDMYGRPNKVHHLRIPQWSRRPLLRSNYLVTACGLVMHRDTQVVPRGREATCENCKRIVKRELEEMQAAC
jgi:hypothetical protein